VWRAVYSHAINVAERFSQTESAAARSVTPVTSRWETTEREAGREDFLRQRARVERHAIMPNHSIVCSQES